MMEGGGGGLMPPITDGSKKSMSNRVNVVELRNFFYCHVEIDLKTTPKPEAYLLSFAI